MTVDGTGSDAVPGPGARTAATYGTRRAGPGTWLGVALLAVVSVVAAYAFARPLFGTPQDVRFQLLAFEIDPAADAVTLRWLVDRDPALEGEVVCVVRSRNEAGEEVGRAEVPVPDTADERVRMEFRLLTSDRPNTGEITDCGVRQKA